MITIDRTAIETECQRVFDTLGRLAAEGREQDATWRNLIHYLAVLVNSAHLHDSMSDPRVLNARAYLATGVE